MSKASSKVKREEGKEKEGNWKAVGAENRKQERKGEGGGGELKKRKQRENAGRTLFYTT